MDQNLLHFIFVSTTVEIISAAVLVIRVFIGICFVVHGLGKLGLVGSGSMAGFEGWLKSLNIPMPALQARLAMITEIAGGLLITIGLATRVGALMLLITMIVAALIGHRGGGYLITNNPPGNEYTINLAAILVALIMIGPGFYSLDAYILG